MRGLGLALFFSLATLAPADEVPPPPPPRAPGAWATQTSGVTTSLNAIAFLNSTEGFAVGAGGVIRRTLDGGASAWTGQTSASAANLNGIGLGSADFGSAVGDTGTILQTQNGSTGAGSTWASVTTGNLAAIGAYDPNHAWTAGVPGALRVTADGGTNWTIGNPGSTTAAVRGMSFLTTPTEGYWVGDMGTVMKTLDGATWTPTGPPGTSNNLNSVSMVASSLPGSATGWLVGDMGVLRKTTNSGVSWTTVPPPSAQNLNGVFAGDATHAWAVGNSGTIVVTTDGINWMPHSSPAPANLMAVSFFFSAGSWKGVAVGAGGATYWTTNGGLAWNPGTSGTASALRGVAMLSGTDAIAVGDGGIVLQSSNGGNTWVPTPGIPTTENLLALSSVSPTVGFVSGTNGTLLKGTLSGGTWTWIQQVGGTSNNLRDVKYGSSDVALAVGGSATILRSTNKGGQWVPLQSTDAAWGGRNLNSIAFGTTDRAIAVGPSGGILVTNNQGTTWTTVPPTTPLTDELFSVAAISPTFFVAVGGSASGAVVGISYDTTAGTWSATVSTGAPSMALKGVAFAPYSRQGYAVADAGQIQATRDAGSTWTPEVSGSTNNIRGLTFPYQGLGWAVTSGGEILVRQSPAPPLLSFPPHIGTPYTWIPPIIDGFVNPELSELRRPDTGWNQCLQVTYADGTSQPPLTFQGLRQNGGNALYVSFEMRADTGFDNDDSLVLLFRGDNPNPRPDHAANDRRIIINPVSTGTGTSGGPIIADGYVAPSYTNQENGDPRTLTSYKWDTGTNAWVAIPASTEIVCKVRSWIPTSGNYCWSVELKIPTVNTTYTDWINIGTDFLFSFYALRVQTGGVVESSWPRDLAISGPVDLVAAPMPAFDWGTAKLGTADDGVGVRIKVPSYQNIGVTTPLTPPGTLETSIHGTLENTFHVFVQNNAPTDALNVLPTFRIADWGVQSGDPLSGAWHLVPANQGTVNPPPAATVPAISGTTPGVTEYQIKWLITDPAVRAAYAAHPHQCILVTLDSTSNVNFTERSSWTNMDYVPASEFGRKAWVSSQGYGLEGARKGIQRFFLHTTAERFDYTPGKVPLDVVPAPVLKRDLPSENNRGVHPYYTGENLQRERLLEVFPGLKQETTTVSHYTWAIHAVKETSRTVKINGHVYPILEQANGFGYIARHGSAVDQWTSGLSGAIVKRLNENEYEVDVPANGSQAMDSVLEAGDLSGRSGGLFGLLLMILLFLLIIFWFLKKQP